MRISYNLTKKQRLKLPLGIGQFVIDQLRREQKKTKSCIVKNRSQRRELVKLSSEKGNN